ncbi:reverse transcriptase/maturase family protein [Leptolyngbya sp. NIES-2104]|uniref:reverse transcriptase/maturase family protein n=1 Tax=Leptolyngbya sp. NIES-2104 TaxID=1552121 RepID=UPI0006EC8782|nr:reverse transcriptase/maturase family protein [Leptolyngbya sp. NIES-2104]GAP99718.1 retron-type RNA-directed DNA polymerase [Leptolyngbya sp. NIES-2104]
MREAETVLDIIRGRGHHRSPLKDLYRQLYNPQLYLRAYGRIYRNKGALTKGTTAETVDGMSMDKIHAIIEAIRYERYRWTPVRRVYIPKKNGKTRPLGLPSWSDKLLQEVIRSLLEAYYEPQFSDSSHGFRPGRGCHTALSTIKRVWHGTKWFIEGDIQSCFDSIDSEILLKILQTDIPDNRFLRLIRNLLRTGYMENGRHTPTLSGTPQGSILSPILSNLYLNKLDQFVEQTLIPAYTKGQRRAHHAAYNHLTYRIRCLRQQGQIEAAHELEQLRRSVPANDPNDPNYRRLRYVRYADDFLLGFAGTKQEAEAIKEQLRTFLQEELKLELSEDKTLITHAHTEPARFLGYDISITHCDSKITTNRRSVNGGIALRMPISFMKDRCRFYMKRGKPIHRMERTHNTDYSIISQYQSEYRGYVQYYQLADNIAWLNQLHWVMRTSLLKTLAHKHKSSVAKMARRYRAKLKTAEGWRTCLEITVPRADKSPLIARFGGIPLKVNLTATIRDQALARHPLGRTELLQRLLADTCEICASTQNIEVHHIRKLADLNSAGRKSKPDRVHLMAARQRKTLVLCRKCHDDLHAGRPLRGQTERVTGEP